MKRKLVVYLAGLLTVLGLGFGQAQFSDVPAGHWAKEAVERIAACGLITGFPDGTFRGNQNLTRYQAALIFQRLLNEIQQGGECVRGSGNGQGQGGLSEEDLTVIRNAVQELAAELAALGVRVSALEDNAATKDDIARLEAAIEELKAMRAQPEPAPGMDEAALADLADRVEAASVAADTALAQAQVLAERLDAVEGDVAALKTQIEADADSIRALNELAVLLNQDVLSLQDRVTAVEKQLAQLGEVDFEAFANREDVAAIQEFATALRADLVRLADRVSALDARVSGLDQRLSQVEGTRPSLTGSVTLRYGYNYTEGANYDIRRLYPNVWDDYTWDANDNGQTVDDADFNNGGDNRARVITTFTVARTPGSTAGFNFQEARIQLRWTQDGAPRLEDALPTVGFTQNVASGIPQVMVVSVKGNIDGQPFSIAYNRFNAFRFTNYFMSNADPNYTAGLGRGVKVDFSATKAPFSPTYTVVFGGTGDSNFVVGGNPSGVRDYFGIRSTVNLLGLTAGVNYAEYNVREAATGRAGFALDLNGKLFGFLGLEAEYVATKPVSVANWDFSNPNAVDQASVIKLSTSLGPVSIEANARAIDPQFKESGYNANNAGLSIDFQTSRDNKRPYDDDTRGFGVKGTLNLGFVSLTGQIDRNTDFFGTSTQNTLAVDVNVPLFAGFSLAGFYYNVTDAGGALLPSGAVLDLDSKYGGRLSHDGKAANALIKDLNLFAEYRFIETTAAGDYDRTDLLFGAKYEGKIGPFGITPLIFFDSAGGSSSGSELKFGAQIKTDPFNLGFINPGFEGAYVSRSSNIGGASRGETYWYAGVSFSNFFFNGGTLAVKYASYSGTGLNAAAPTLGVEDHLYDHTTGYIYSDNTGLVNFTLTGLLVTYRYAGVGLDYHMGNLNTGGTDNRSYGFRISYSFSW